MATCTEHGSTSKEATRTLAAPKAPSPAVTLLVAASRPPRQRLARTLRVALRLPGHVLAFASETISLPWVLGLPALLALVDRWIAEGAEHASH